LNSSLETIVAEQGIIKARYEYQTAEVNATTTVINCQAQANITGTNTTFHSTRK
jgi:hypothetical protein